MKGLEYITPSDWADYELVDSGGGEKLERFGAHTLVRPEPQAVWNKTLSAREWERLAHATFRRSAQSDERGEWIRKPSMPDRWRMSYDYKGMHLKMRLAMTSFKHVGIFPEQAANWNFIYDNTHRGSRILNLFAYTGGATLAALAAGAEAVHVDAVKQVVAWARENADESGLSGARWIVDDALKFVRREERRGNRYDGIILDPPAYGRGPDGEKWVLERDIAPLLGSCANLLAPGGYVVFNLYSMGLSPLIARTAARQAFGIPAGEQFGELYLADRAEKILPLGVYYRGSQRESATDKQ
jgi:23S rRNA (cytosine1962-C5)-methyltransferase